MRGVDAPDHLGRLDEGLRLHADDLERTTRKYCGMKTTVIEIAAAMMPGQRPDWPPLIAIAATMASSSVGKA